MLKPSSRRLSEAAALLGPLALVVVMRSDRPEPIAPPPAAVLVSAALMAESGAPAPMSDDQRLALEWLAARDRDAAMVSPMDHPTPRPVRPVAVAEPEAVTPADEPEAGAEVSPLEGFKLTAIVGTSDGGLASINGRVYRIGDELAAGWRISEIDVQAQTVTATNEDGRSATIRQDRPHMGR